MNELDLMLHTLSALDKPTMYTFTGVCPVCLVKTEYHTRTKPKEAEASIVCQRCSREMDAPVPFTDTRIY
jgi:transcription elongation factor Elf1